MVNVSAIELRGVDLPRVAASLESQGRVAGEHLLSCGLRRFAYVGFVQLAYVRQQYQAFSKTIRKVGASCIVFRLNRPVAADWSAGQQELASWLQALPKPVGVLAWNTNDGRRVIDACRLAKLSVPEQVAILTCDDDEILCEACSPSLSGVVTPVQQIGRDAAALLDRLMCGRRPPKRPLFIDPIGVASRHSTDILAVEDQELAQAVRFIRTHASQRIGVSDVLRAVPISRRRLEMGFREELGLLAGRRDPPGPSSAGQGTVGRNRPIHPRGGHRLGIRLAGVPNIRVQAGYGTQSVEVSQSGSGSGETNMQNQSDV